MKLWRLAWRFTRRDLASGEVRVLLAALMLAVAGVTAVAAITDRAERALAMEANRLLGGDAVLRADQPIGEAPRALARQLGLQVAEVQGFPSMVRAGEALRLSDIRALSEGYPLRGEFRLLDAAGTEYSAEGVPAPGEVWISRAGAEALELAIGSTLRVGQRELRVAALIAQEPDAALDYFNVAPKVSINLGDLESTGLVQVGSRITHRLAVAGEASAVARWIRAQRDDLGRGQRLETVQDARPELRQALDRADRFLGLAALVAVVLSAIAVAMAARRHSARHLDACAVLRCLGADQRSIVHIQLGELLILGLSASLIGALAGYGIQAGVTAWLASALGLDVPAPGLLPLLQGVAVGLIVLFAFAAPPVLALRRVPALRVLRRDLGAVEPSAIAVAGLGLGAMAGLIWWKAGSFKLGAAMLGGLLGTFLVLALLAMALVFALSRLRGRLRGVWRYGLANVSRRARVSVAQIGALGLGLMVLLMLGQVRGQLLDRWQDAIPADAPNRFVVGIQDDQLEGARALLQAQGVGDAPLFPMVRGRLVQHNDTPVSGATYANQGERAQRLAEREFNLSWARDLADDGNPVVAGRAWDPAGERPEVSVEEGIARVLGWSLGDRIAFDVAGRVFEAEITSLRQVTWEGFRPNFFVVANAPALAGSASSYITAVRVPSGDVGFTRSLVGQFPNVSVIDVDAIIEQVQRTARQATMAVEYVFFFTLAAGLLVLVAAVSSSQDERLLEGGVMRVLGARSRQLRLAQASEFLAIGLIAAGIAALAATGLTAIVADQVFELPFAPDWLHVAGGFALGVGAVLLTGLAATRRVVSAPPSTTLRALQG
ncbi:MAG: FtsX-like permease family protein [Aquimonas sp.]|nr:FtsX-like permease family protein [Aquimonas sp.]